jgi:hypothetical protein
MDNFFTFIDKINKPIFVLYDKNFIHINENLLNSLGFTSQNRPGSLTQIVESKWKNKLADLKINEEIEIPLMMHGGKIQKYWVRMHPLEIEKSEYNCFILSVKDFVDQNLDIVNRIFCKIPFPAFVFNNEFEIIQNHNAFEFLKKISVNSFDDLKKIFQINNVPDFSKNEIYSYKSVDSEMELFLFNSLSDLSNNFFAGIITQPSKNNNIIDIDFVKDSISHSIQRLIHVQKLYGNQNNITHSIWEGIHNEITSLSQIRRHMENGDSLVKSNNNKLVYLDNLIINEIEILKSNDIFRQNVKIIAHFANNHDPLHQKYSDIAGYIISLIDQIAKISCQTANNELFVETIDEDGLIWLKVFIKINGKSSKQKTNIFENMLKYENQFREKDVKFICNINSKNDIDLSLGFEK